MVLCQAVGMVGQRVALHRDWLLSALGEEVEPRAIDIEAALGSRNLERRTRDAGNKGGFEGSRKLIGPRILQHHIDRVGRSAAIRIRVDPTNADGCVWNFLAHEHVYYVNPVCKQIGDLPAAEIEIGAPVVILLRIVIPPFDRTQKLRPIQVAWFRLQ